MRDESVWPSVWEFACACMLVALAALALFGLTSCAAAPPVPPPRVLMVPHVCQPTVDSPAFQKCSADCPEGHAFILENANDTSCFCSKPPAGT